MISAKGSTTGRTGSSKPQLLSVAFLGAACAAASEASWAPLPFLAFFFPLGAPLVPVPARDLDDMAVLSAAKMALQCSAWPSLAAFSMGPAYQLAHI